MAHLSPSLGAPERVRVAVIADLANEQWPSMNLVADMLVSHLRTMSCEPRIDVELLRPVLTDRKMGLGRFVNRFWDYAWWLKRRAGDFDIFHIVDHSYAHLVHVLPAARTVVTCHDVDTFLPLADPALTRTKLPRIVVRALLSGLRRAASVTCASRATHDELVRYGLVAAERLHVVLNGTDDRFSPQPDGSADRAVNALLGTADPNVVNLLHVGTTIPRKRIDVLLRIVGAVRERDPRVRLVKAGGRLNAEQRDLMRSLGLRDHVVELPSLETHVLAAVYRRAAAVLMTSDREGFGLPVVEALASGTPVVATDLPVLREVGGVAARYCPLGDIEAWRNETLHCLRVRERPDVLAMWQHTALEQARLFSWDTYAASMLHVYRTLWSGPEWQVGAQKTCANGS